MSRSLSPRESQRRALARREGALARNELKEASSPRAAAAGPTSFPVKARDAGLDAMIRDFENKRRNAE